MILNNKILTLLGFAAKAGKLCYGFEASVAELKKGKAKLLIAARDLSPKSLKEANYFSLKANVKVLTLKDVDIDTLSNAVGHRCGILSVLDSGFADAIIKQIDAM